MPVTVCWALKGGSGTTLIAAALALSIRTDSLLVDLDGELPMVIGVPEPVGQGIADWLSSDAPGSALAHLAVDIDRTTRLIPRGTAAPNADNQRWHDLVGWLANQRSVIVDAGTGTPPTALVGDDVRSLLVTRNCYLALRRAALAGCRPDGVVLVNEPGRALGKRAVEHSVGAPVIASVNIDPAVSRSVDAGLLLSRLPRALARDLRGAA